MSNFTQIKKEFNSLSQKEKDALLKDIYGFSQDMKIFLQSRLLVKSDAGKLLVKEMEKETIKKVYANTPKDVSGRKVNAIISKAKKAKVDIWTMLELEKLAFRGFIEMMNEYGFWDENIENMGCRHFGIYLSLVKTKVNDKEEKLKLLEEARQYLHSLNNMSTDYFEDTYGEIVGTLVN